jgi:deoxyhypusine monooxygenase
MRAVFTLRNLGGNESVDALRPSLRDNSALLAHEVAYCMGQMKNPHAIPYLSETLKDKNLNAMVRHEAGEALGAIGDPVALPILEEYLKDELPEIRETCQVAIDLINWKLENKENADANGNNPVFMSVDPAPAEDFESKQAAQKAQIEKLKGQLLDTKLSIFKRYRALFALRNINTPDAVLAICSGFKDESALFRHEIAYVLGQMQHPVSIPSLAEVLKTTEEHAMVRHEAAEALGAMGDNKDTIDVAELLTEYQADHAAVVKDSCTVALDIMKYWSENEFQYADGLADKH